jgi:hypothetical protein
MSNPTAETVAAYPFCQHGARLGSSTLPAGMWNGPVAQCGCCFATFGYIDSGSISVSDKGLTKCSGRSWSPKDRCGSCGGTYHDY